jgi:ribonuclease Z
MRDRPARVSALGGSTPDYWRLTFLGTGGYRSSLQCGMPAALFGLGAERHLFNAGDGTVRQLYRLESAKALTAVWLTSCESETTAGLITLLDYFAGIDQVRLPRLYGPVGLAQLLSRLKTISGADWEALEITEVGDGAQIDLGGETVTAVEIGSHAGGCRLGYRIVERDWPGPLDPQEAERLGARRGPDFARLKQGETVKGVSPANVVGANRPGRRLGLSWAGRPSRALQTLADSLQLLALSAPYIDERLEVAQQAGYCTGIEAASIAASNAVEQLALLQISGHVRFSYARAEAAQVFERVGIPGDGDRYLIPLPDAGSVVVERRRFEAMPRSPRTNQKRRSRKRPSSSGLG